MNISGMMNITSAAVATDLYNSNENPLSLKKAIKAYKDEMLTGLTDDEKEEIERLAKEYLKEKPLETQEDKDSFNMYIKSLLKKFGFKGDIDAYAVDIAGGAQDEAENAKNQSAPLSVNEHYERTALGVMSAKNKLLS